MVNRRNLLGLLNAGLAGMSLPVYGKSPAQRPKAKPNFILIFADDLGYGDIPGFGLKESTVAAPRLSRMASEGVKLTGFHVPTPYCAPSRATILTGRYPFRNNVVFNPHPGWGINEVGLPASEITIAEALKKAGYKSACIGKWHLGHTPEYMPQKQGFDKYFGILYSNDMHPVQLVENEKVVEYPVVQAELTKKYTQKAEEFMEECSRSGSPFFLYLAHAMPHKPLAASEKFYTPDTPEDLYDDVIRELDWSVGRVLDKVKKLGLDDNTLVIFTSDNGPYYGGSTGGLRGMKATTWDGGLRVPLIARWKGHIPAGIVNHSLAGTIDIFPTFLNAAGLEMPKDRVIDGRDILPLLISADEESPHEALFAMHGVFVMTVRSGKWKLHLRASRRKRQRCSSSSRKKQNSPNAPDGKTIIAPYEQYGPDDYPGSKKGEKAKKMMLFNIEEDPAEEHDLSKKHPDIVKQLKAYYNKTVPKNKKFKRPPRKFKKMQKIKGGKTYPPY